MDRGRCPGRTTGTPADVRCLDGDGCAPWPTAQSQTTACSGPDKCLSCSPHLSDECATGRSRSRDTEGTVAGRGALVGHKTQALAASDRLASDRCRQRLAHLSYVPPTLGSRRRFPIHQGCSGMGRRAAPRPGGHTHSTCFRLRRSWLPV